jgi:tryptophanyl-tRNA synthetase
LLFSIVGWHALTLPQNARALEEARKDMMAAVLAVGVDPERSIVFHQDQVSFLFRFQLASSVGISYGTKS